MVPKSDFEVSVLLDIMQSNYLFQALDNAQLTNVIEVMKPISCGACQDIVKQGDEG